MSTTAEQLKILVENAYAHVPTLPGFFLDYRQFCQILSQMTDGRYDPNNLQGIKELILALFPSVTFKDDYTNPNIGIEQPITVIRLTPNCIKRQTALRKQILHAIDHTPATIEGWKDMATIGSKINSALLHDLGFEKLSQAIEVMFPYNMELRRGSVENHEPPLMLRPRNSQPPKPQVFPPQVPEHIYSPVEQIMPFANSAVKSQNNSAPQEGNQPEIVGDQPAPEPTTQQHHNQQIQALKQRIIATISAIIPADDGWKNFAYVGQRADGIKKTDVQPLGFASVREAVITLFPERYEFRTGNPDRHEPPCLVREINTNNHPATPINAPAAPNPDTTPKSKNTARISAYDKLIRFAAFLTYNDAIATLAQKALPEQWHYGTTPKQNPYPILKNYFELTFERIQYEDFSQQKRLGDRWIPKIRISQDQRFAVFNTGLVDRLYEPIYAFFVRNRRQDKQPWLFRAFVASTDYERQELTRIFGADLPDTAHYYNTPAELVYNIRAEIGSYNWPHIIDHCERLPINFLKANIPDFDYNRPHNRAFFKELSQTIKNDSYLYHRVTQRLREAIEFAVKRVRWNFKTAVPVYYASHREISLLLPLSLEHDGNIDVALVLERTRSAYIAHTILTMDMAYRHARLITRPDTDWLVARNIEQHYEYDETDTQENDAEQINVDNTPLPSDMPEPDENAQMEIPPIPDTDQPEQE